MLRYFLKRLLSLIPVLIGVAFLIFTMMYFTPGDPATVVLGDQASAEQLAQWRAARDLDKPFPEQFGKYMYRLVFRGDFGVSYKTGRNVTVSLLERFPTTFLLAIATCATAMLLGVLLGILAANRQSTWVDSVLRIFGMAGVSMPIFWLGLLLILWFAVDLKWFPVSGWYGPKYIVLPAMTMGLTFTASLMRTTRSSMLDCIRQDYVVTARAKGQKERVITYHHVFRNALIPIITAAGSTFGIALCGAVVTEQVFSIPGLGSLMVNAITTRDYPLVRGSVLLLAVSFSLVNLLVDLLYAWFDPRIKAQFTGKSRKKRKTGEETAHE
ncbi:MAG: ABC transporter permease [Synergistaceae bacterium]|jgi:peptide/nickel transport system permease protein|nr:ABC transporter permease [Synergistaceae bacterium]